MAVSQTSEVGATLARHYSSVLKCFVVSHSELYVTFVKV